MCGIGGDEGSNLVGSMQQMLVWHDLVDQTPLERSLGVKKRARQAELLGAANTDGLGQHDREAPAGEQANAGVGIGEAGTIGGDEEIASECDLESACDRSAVDGTDHWFAMRWNGSAIWRWGIGFAPTLAGAELAQIEARAKRRIGSGEDDGVHVVVVVAPRDRRWKRRGKLGVERVARIGTIEGDGGNAVDDVDQYGVHQLCPATRTDTRPL